MAVLNPYVPKPRYVPKHKRDEESLQLRVASYLRKHYPHVDFISDWAAGAYLSPNQARVRARMQSGRGWSDIFIAQPSRGYHGCFIELKRDKTSIYVSRGPRKGKLVADPQIQIEAAFIQRKNEQGYFARFGVGYDKTIRLIEWYFGNENAELF